jgi:hypothetical protein
MNKSFEEPQAPRPRKTARRRHSISRQRGRPTPDDVSLTSYRDDLAWLLSVKWEDIGYKLQKAETLDELREALNPLLGHPSDYLVTRFLHPTPIASTTAEIRLLRERFGDAIEKLRGAQTKYDSCASASTKVEGAMNQSAAEQLGSFFPELLKAWKSRAESQKNLEVMRAASKAIEDELANKEAGFSQSELLDFIKRKLYARDPLVIANVMAGLPLINWQTSRTRCAKIPCKQWPIFQYRVFLTIEAIWNRRDSHPPLPSEQLFRREITRLTRTIMVLNPDTGKKHRQAESLRKHFADHFYHLKNAIEEIRELKITPSEVPFRIAAAFTKNLGKPRTARDEILIERERIK